MTDNRFGELNQNKAQIEQYSKGDWIRVISGAHTHIGRIDKVNLEVGELVLDKSTQYVNNEKGQVIDIVEKISTVRLIDISNHRPSSEEEAKLTVETQSPFYNKIGKYVGISANGTTWTGKVDKLFLSHVELRPFMNFRNGSEAYIEEEESLCVPIGGGVPIIPRTRKDLEHFVKEANKQDAEKK